jgi:GT2 family glycosyltransferase
VDLSFRAQMAGWKVFYTPEAIAFHSVGSTSSKMGDFARYHSAKNFLLLYARNMPTKLYWKYFIPFSLQFFRMALTSILRLKFGVFLKGTWAALQQHGKTRKVRNANLSRQKIATNFIDDLLVRSRPPKTPSIS